MCCWLSLPSLKTSNSLLEIIGLMMDRFSEVASQH